MAPGDRRDRTYSGTKDGGYHLLLLAQNHAGYRNLLKLASIAYLEGFYFKPRIDKQTLKAHSDGLIVTSACLGGEIPTALTADDRKKRPGAKLRRKGSAGSSAMQRETIANPTTKAAQHGKACFIECPFRLR